MNIAVKPENINSGEALAGKVSLVTGSTSGIGLGIARALAAAGSEIVLNGFGKPEEVADVQTKIAADFKVRVTFSPADMSKPAAIREMIEKTLQTSGRLDILVNNAGIQHVAPLQDFPPEKWDVANMRETTMNGASKAMVRDAVDEFRTNAKGQVVLVLQGGGALGAYQVGVYQALHEAGVEPDWIIGTSIGAINASIIAGNAPQDRLTRLNEFWRKMERPDAWPFAPAWTGISNTWSYWATLASGIPGFFQPNPPAFWGAHVPLPADRAGFYSTASLRGTLAELVDFSIVNKQPPRLTVGAANVRTSMMHYFDSRACEIAAEHIMASGALPPAFPAVRIEGEYYWDGGILSNTPTEVIFDDNPRRNSLIFAVHLWNPTGPEPRSIWEVLNRQKDVQYSSRIASHITRQQQTHRLRHVVSQLVRYLPDDVRKSEAVRELAGYGCVTQMHVVRLLAPRLENENHTKDIDFTPSGIRMRREAGYEATMRALMQAPWLGEFDPIEGVILHESMPDLAMAAE